MFPLHCAYGHLDMLIKYKTAKTDVTMSFIQFSLADSIQTLSEITVD